MPPNPTRQLLAFVAGLAIVLPGLVVAPARAEQERPDDAIEGVWNPWRHVQIWIRPPGTNGLPLGHARLVVKGRYYEHTPLGDDELLQEPSNEALIERRRKQDRFLACLSPEMRIPFTVRLVWGQRYRAKVEPATQTPMGIDDWPFERFVIPITRGQLAEFERLAEISFADGQDTVIAHDFQYSRNNCTTWVSRLLAEALSSEQTGRPGEQQLVTLLSRRVNTPGRLLRELRRWDQTYGKQAQLSTSN